MCSIDLSKAYDRVNRLGVIHQAYYSELNMGRIEYVKVGHGSG